MVVGFVVGEEFRAVGFAEDDGAGGAKFSDGGGIVRGFVAGAVEATSQGGLAGDVEAVFDGEGDAGEGATGRRARIEQADEGAETRIDGGDAILVGAEEFGGGDFATA